LKPTTKIHVAGHRGMVGAAIVDELTNSGYTNIITRSRDELDLRDQQKVNAFINEEKPDAVIIAAARVGGILANDRYPYQFLYDDLMVEFLQNHVYIY